MVRVVPSHRWDQSRVLDIAGTPGDEKTQQQQQDAIEAEPNPQRNAESEDPATGGESDRQGVRRLKITKADVM